MGFPECTTAAMICVMTPQLSQRGLDVPAVAIGIDLGGTHFNAGLVRRDDSGWSIAERVGDRTPVEGGAAGVVERLASAVREVAQRAGVSIEALAGVGVAAPGAVDHTMGLIREAPNLRWVGVPLRAMLAGQLGLPPERVVVENDVNAALLGERAAGAAAGMDGVVGVWVGTGVGGAIVLNGRLHHGGTGSAGEIGQTILMPRGTADTRVMEMVCSRKSVQARIARLMAANRPSVLAELIEAAGETLDRYSATTLARAYHAGDPLVASCVDEGADLLGVAIANVLTVLGVSAVVLGGGMTEALGQPYLDRVERSIKASVFPALIAERLVLRPTQLAAGAGMIGAAWGVIEGG
jgi:glucokinase